MQTLDMNTILSNHLHDLNSIKSPINNKLIIDCNLTDIKKICQLYGFTTLLSESKSQTKLNKTEKKLKFISSYCL